MNQRIAVVGWTIIIIIWIACIASWGFNWWSITIAVIGTLAVGGGMSGIIKAKGEMYLANKYDEQNTRPQQNTQSISNESLSSYTPPADYKPWMSKRGFFIMVSIIGIIILAAIVAAIMQNLPAKSSYVGNSKNTNYSATTSIYNTVVPGTTDDYRMTLRNYPSPTAAPTPVKPKLELVSNQSTSDQYMRYIEGIVKNNTYKTYSYVSITFNLFDANGNQVGSAIDMINDLAPQGTWSFKATIWDDRCKKYRLSSIDGY